MNRLASSLIGPELVWLLLFGLVRVLASQNQPATPTGNAQLEQMQWYLALLGVLISFLPLFWATDNLWWWLLRIGLTGLIGVFLINTTLVGGIDYGDSRNAGLGTALLITIPLGCVLLLVGVGVIAIFHLLNWNFRSALKWLLIGVGCLTGLVLWAGCTSKSETKLTSKPAPQPTPNAPQLAQKNALASYTWFTELCEHQGSYDPHRYTEEQLKGTYSLWTDNWNLEAPTLATTPADIGLLNVNILYHEYRRMQALLNALTIVDVPYWQHLKQQRLRAMDSEYELKKLSIDAYSMPALLRQTDYTPAAAPYVNALTSGDTTALLAAWQDLHEQQKKRSGLPEQLAKEFEQKYYSADSLAFARIELMAYGWWNNVVHVEPYMELDEQMEREFEDLFVTSKVTCEES